MFGFDGTRVYFSRLKNDDDHIRVAMFSIRTDGKQLKPQGWRAADLRGVFEP